MRTVIKDKHGLILETCYTANQLQQKLIDDINDGERRGPEYTIEVQPPPRWRDFESHPKSGESFLIAYDTSKGTKWVTNWPPRVVYWDERVGLRDRTTCEPVQTPQYWMPIEDVPYE